MGTPLVSVVIPCFNAEKYLRDAIVCALAQTYQPVEVIVVDDGSTDGSLETAQSFGSRIRLISRSHQGAPAARNCGIEAASGEYIQLLDADDLLDPGKLEHHRPFIERGDGGLSFCDGRATCETGRDFLYDASLNPGDDAVCYVLANSLPTVSPVYRKRALLQVHGFREDLPCAQEFDLHLRMACAGIPFMHMPGKFYTQRKVEGGISRDYGKVLRQFENIIPPAYRDLENRGNLSEDRRRVFAEAMCRAASHILKLGDDETARRYFEIAASMHNSRGYSIYRPPVRLLHRALGPVRAQRLIKRLRG